MHDQIRIDVCPGKQGYITLTGPADLTTADAAKRQGLTAKNEPCAQDVAPDGVFTNRSTLPNTGRTG